MVRSLITFALILCFLNCYGQQKLPDTFNKDTVLKPIGKPYESSGFTVEKGVTLTIMPGTTISFSNNDGAKGAVTIMGTLKIGDASGAKPVIFNGSMGEIHFKDSTIDINGWDVEGPRIQFFGDNKGNIKNSKLKRRYQIPYSFNCTVPKTDSLNFIDCLFEDYDIDITTSDFPNDLTRLSFRGCAFTYVYVNKQQRGYYFKPKKVSTQLFAYGTKCDIYISVEFKAMNWEFKTPRISDWFIAKEDIKSSVSGSAKTAKNFVLKCSSQKLTKFVQPPDPAEPEKKD